MGGNYSKAKGRGNTPPFVLLRHDMMESYAWRALSANAQALWLHIRKRYNSFNNGRIALSCREAGILLHVSKNTAAEVFNELKEKGFIAVGQDSSFTLKTKTARRWIMTHETYNGRAPTNEWRKWKQEE